MASYCCFVCPSAGRDNTDLNAQCPTCGRPFGFPLTQLPTTIGSFTVLEQKGRGFYAATYLCEAGVLRERVILKVSPVELYDFFRKDFVGESRKHAEVAADTEHIVQIRDVFDVNVTFGGTTLRCHVAVLQYVPGELLSEFFESAAAPSASECAQIAIDLVRIWRELTNKEVFHNDLHANNVIVRRLAEGARRAEAINGLLRVVAIDLGSVSDASKSDSGEERLGDQHWLYRHIQRLAQKLWRSRDTVDQFSDVDARLTETLERIAGFLVAAANLQRPPSSDQLITMVKDAFTRIQAPWRDTLSLQRFDDSYNAQALEPWFVPLLIVDPEEQWMGRIAKPGPIVVVGMRGCGKTMLLRSLDFHARASMSKEDKWESIRKRIEDDKFVGLFVSSTRLLTTPGSGAVSAPMSRVFLAYCIEAIRAARHLQDRERGLVYAQFYEELGRVVDLVLDLSKSLADATSDQELERQLLSVRAELEGRTDAQVMRMSPADAFSALAEAVRRCSPVWAHARIFFLLDDVSTRYLTGETIAVLFEALIFQSPVCAFKVSTEAQTLELVLRSPGGVERAREGRDYEQFDLGAEVYARTRDRKRRAEPLFIESVLRRRAAYFHAHPKESPATILGDCALEEIAKRIATSAATARERKSIYNGITALSAVCVGDIGDVISLYELILRKGAGKKLPVPKELQSEAYQDFCSRRLYDLNRRSGQLKDFALTFSEASHELLMQSGKGTSGRLRQYSSIYVRVTTGDSAKQFKQLRELIDAGVFVLVGGSPRSKSQHGDPILQFKLTYRKLFGLSYFIGLAERDRFELSGAQLEEWLAHPEKGREILLRNLSVEEENGDANGLEDSSPGVGQPRKAEKTSPGSQQKLEFDAGELPQGVLAVQEATGESRDGRAVRVRASMLDLGALGGEGIRTIVLGLGFEDRALESARRLLSVMRPEVALAVEYEEKGRSEEILDTLQRHGVKVKKIAYRSLDRGAFGPAVGPTLIDVSGLAKPALFLAVRSALASGGVAWLGHTRAETYYPTDADVSDIVSAATERDHHRLMESLSRVLTGEAGPYTMKPLLHSDADESRRRYLCAFASAKHQRLLSLLDARDYDQIGLVVARDKSARASIARLVAEVAATGGHPTSSAEIESDDLVGTLAFIGAEHEKWYAERGYNFEVGLTGSKLQACAAAAVSVDAKLAQCWYVSPASFDARRFTQGVGSTTVFRIDRIGR